jgi:hypothetical protein
MEIIESIIEQAKKMGLIVEKRRDGFMISGEMNIKSDYLSDEPKDYGKCKVRIGLGEEDAYFSISLNGSVFSTSYSFEELLSILQTNTLLAD